MRRRDLRPLAGALSEARGAAEPSSLLARVQRLWPDAVGEALAGEARPVSELSGTVTIACRSSVWAQELTYLGTDLAAKLNDRLAGPGHAGQVADLRFVTGPLDRTSQRSA